MAKSKTPIRVNDVLRPKFGPGSILAQSEVVSKAFGRWPGFALMVLALLVSLAFSAGMVVVIARGFSRLFG